MPNSRGKQPEDALTGLDTPGDEKGYPGHTGRYSHWLEKTWLKDTLTDKKKLPVAPTDCFIAYGSILKQFHNKKTWIQGTEPPMLGPKDSKQCRPRSCCWILTFSPADFDSDWLRCTHSNPPLPPWASELTNWTRTMHLQPRHYVAMEVKMFTWELSWLSHLKILHADRALTLCIST